MSVRGGAVLAKALSRFGVKRIFSLPGHQILAVYDACLDLGIEVISTRHEASAVYMAEAHAYASREAGVVLIAGGPELTNALTGIAKAYYTGTPLVVLSGTNTLEKLDRGFPQDMDQLAVVRPFTKWARGCYDARRIPEYLATAYRQSRRGRPGPVFLEIPYNLLEGEVKGAVHYPDKPAVVHSAGEPSALEQGRVVLASARRPIAIAGSGAVWSRADETLETFVRETSLPLFLAPTGLPLQLSPEVVMGYGTPGAGAFSMDAIAQADVLLLLGERVDFALGFGQEPFMSRGQCLIQVDPESEALGSVREADIPIFGDVKQVLTTWLEGGFHNEHLAAWVEKLLRRRAAYRDELVRITAADQVPVHPLHLVEELERGRGERSTLVLDGANSVLWNFLSMRPRSGGQIVLSPAGSLESIGAGVPHALALKLANPERDVLLHVGDGSLGYHLMEFETAVRYGIPFVAVVHNDSGWGMTRDMQAEFFGAGREIGNRLLAVRYDLLVRALGGYGEHVTDPGEIAGAVRRAFDSGLPACINVAVDPKPRSPGLEIFMLLEIMLGHDSFYDRIPDVIRRAERVGLGRLTSRLMRRYMARKFRSKMR
jgi:acetolactate synthase-1/2/3 large subunit